MKKFFALLLALIMVLSLATTALADDPATTYTITINNAETDHIYDAYQIFSGDLHNGILSNIEWGTGVAKGDDLLAALKADTFEFDLHYQDEYGVAQVRKTTLSAELHCTAISRLFRFSICRISGPVVA